MQTGSDNMYFFYDENDSLVSLNVDGDDYFYVENLQGDIIALTDVDGNIVVEYLYDAWGRLLSTTGSMAGTLGAANPFRYRGYFFDSETGLYYLQSRYYMPEWGRFLSPDAVEYIDGSSLYAYCGNNPVNRIDPAGHSTSEETVKRILKDMGYQILCKKLQKLKLSYIYANALSWKCDVFFENKQTGVSELRFTFTMSNKYGNSKTIKMNLFMGFDDAWKKFIPIYWNNPFYQRMSSGKTGAILGMLGSMLGLYEPLALPASEFANFTGGLASVAGTMVTIGLRSSDLIEVRPDLWYFVFLSYIVVDEYKNYRAIPLYTLYSGDGRIYGVYQSGDGTILFV